MESRPAGSKGCHMCSYHRSLHFNYYVRCRYSSSKKQMPVLSTEVKMVSALGKAVVVAGNMDKNHCETNVALVLFFFLLDGLFVPFAKLKIRLKMGGLKF